MPDNASAPPRWIALEGAVNVRDLGGLPARGGRTRPGVLLRGDNMAGLTPADVTILVERHRLSRLIDLRSSVELIASGPSPLLAAGITHDHLPLLPDADLARRRRAIQERWASGQPTAFAAGYEEYLDLGLASIAAAFATLAAGGVPALVHCTAGRDRTGALVAILLDAAGVDRTAIVADYAATAERATALAVRLAGMSGREQEAVLATAARLATHPQTMENLLAHLDAEHGGSIGLLRTAGISKAQLAEWEHILVAPA